MLTSCDELFNSLDPKEEYVIEETLDANSLTEKLMDGDNFSIMINKGTLKEATTFKVKKISSSDAPKCDLPKTELGKNIYKIKVKGQKIFNPTLEIEIKYDDNYLKSKNLTANDIKGLIYIAGEWYVAEITVNTTTKKISFELPAVVLPNKIKSQLLDDETEITICEGYTTTDSGQSDDFLVKLQKSLYLSVEFAGYHNGINNNEWSYIRFPSYFNLASEEFTDNLTWSGNNFSAEIEGGKIEGSYDTKAKTLNLTAYSDYTRSWADVLHDTVNIESRIRLENVPYDYDRLNMFYKFSGGNNLKNMIKEISYVRTTKNENGTKVEEYKSTDFSKNAWIEIEFMHVK